MTTACAFCAQEHGFDGYVFLGIPLQVCPNLPGDWLAVGPDPNGDLRLVVIPRQLEA